MKPQLYVVWFQDKWTLTLPTQYDQAKYYGKRLAKAYGKGYIVLRKAQ